MASACYSDREQRSLSHGRHPTAQNRQGRYRVAAVDQTVVHPPAGPKAPAGPVQRRVKLRYAALAHDDSAPSPAGEGGTGLNARPSSESEWQPESTATRMTLRPDAHPAGNWIPTLPAHYRLISLVTERAACQPGQREEPTLFPPAHTVEGALLKADRVSTD